METRDDELTQMNKSYFDDLQKHVDETSEELKRTFSGNNFIVRTPASHELISFPRVS